MIDVGQDPKRPYPLCWPAGKPRLPANRRSESKFRVTIENSWNSILEELQDKWQVQDLIVSTNLPFQSGTTLPDVSMATRLGDPGVAVYFRYRGASYAVACDSYSDIRGNMRALAVTFRALRELEKDASSEMAGWALSAFQTFFYIVGSYVPPDGGQYRPPPPPPAPGVPWAEVLGVPPNASKDEVAKAYKRLARKHHPDMGGKPEDFHRITKAKEAADAFFK